MNKHLSLILKCFLVFSVLACGTTEGILIKEQSLSLNQIRQAIENIAGKPRSLSSNQREFISQYFSRKAIKLSEPSFNPETAKERLYTHFWILGDRRPYDIRVQVVVERKSSDGYYVYGEDNQVGQKIVNELKSRLAKGQDGVNVIDNFRPF